MIKIFICLIMLVVIVFASVSPKLCEEVFGMRLLEQEMLTHKTQEKAIAINQAQAPFGRYTEIVNGIKIELVKIPTGAFLMGNDSSPNPEEKPKHQVSVKSFFIGQYEITRQQWNIVADNLPKVNRDLRRQYIGPAFGWVIKESTPADAIFWDDAVEFCDRLSRLTGKRYRLPSEAEWEYACRAGTVTEYSWGNQFDYSLAHFRNFSAGDASFLLLPVGEKGYANNWGLYDMHGNVAEWCLDIKHNNYVGAPIDGSAWNLNGDDRERVQRGGDYPVRVEFGRSSARSFWSRNLGASGFGFRIVAEISSIIGLGKVAPTSAANYSTASLASETITALFGSNLSNGVMQTASSTPLPVSLADASVFIKDSNGNEYASPLFFVSPTQINFQIPAGPALGPATIYAVNNGNIHSSGSLEITNVSPGLFSADASGKGLAAATILRVKANGQQVYEPTGQFDSATGRFVPVPIEVGNPAEQVFVLLFGTGFRNHSGLANVSASVGGSAAEVLFAGKQDDFVGLDQCNVRLSPSLAGRGDVNLALTVDGKASNTVTLRIK